MDELYALQARIKAQQSTIRSLKKSKASADTLKVENDKLDELRLLLENMPSESYNFNRKGFDDLIIRKMYVVPSFEIHNGPSGLFDFGPPACALKANMISLWRQHFVSENDMLEMECTNLTPSKVLETSGHVERFTDFMVRDTITSECFRADKLLEDGIDDFLALESNQNLSGEDKEVHLRVQRLADAYTAEELHEQLQNYNIKSPSNNKNELSKPFPFNLMFKTSIGPEGTQVGFLRPETAQGLFVNFRRLLDYNQSRMPFAAAQVGLGFRNEICPKNGLLRVREFCMAEIEHFVQPNEKNHPKFKQVEDIELTLFMNTAQMTTGKTNVMTIGDAVKNKIVDNETLGYFMARTFIYLTKIGVDPLRIRFRQHLTTEMAHYATDCWDAEIKLSHGWIECVGHADRSCYDLECHSKASNVPLVATRRLNEPIAVKRLKAEPQKKKLGPLFKSDQKLVLAALEALDDKATQELKAKLEIDGKAILLDKYEITPDLVDFVTEDKMVHEEKYVPSVIEPSFGIGRIMYAVLEHSFSQREGDEQRGVMSFPPIVAPIKVGIFRLLNNQASFDVLVDDLHDALQDAGITNRVDSSAGSVGRRYARSDELGIPFGITVDFQSVLDKTVTMRDRDSMSQIRIEWQDVVPVLLKLTSGEVVFKDIMKRYRIVNVGDGEVSEKEKSLTIEETTRGMFYRPDPKLFE